MFLKKFAWPVIQEFNYYQAKRNSKSTIHIFTSIQALFHKDFSVKPKWSFALTKQAVEPMYPKNEVKVLQDLDFPKTSNVHFKPMQPISTPKKIHPYLIDHPI